MILQKNNCGSQSLKFGCLARSPLLLSWENQRSVEAVGSNSTTSEPYGDMRTPAVLLTVMTARCS